MDRRCRGLMACVTICLLSCARILTFAVAQESAAPTWDGPEEHDSHTFRFQTEVERLMDVLIHSVYSDKDVFLRELLSNASDALNRLRIRRIMQPASEAPSLQITIEIDKTARTIKIRDNGVGMTRLELIQNLGTVARSGTSMTVEALQSYREGLIGQFGLGFYSAFLVGDAVEVVSKPDGGGMQHVWSSSAAGYFSVHEDDHGAVSGEGELNRGTLVKLHLRADCSEYLQEGRLRELVADYSEFLRFPIFIVRSEDLHEVEQSEETMGNSKAAWKRLNQDTGLLQKNPNDVPEAEYASWYQSLVKHRNATPLGKMHFWAEGSVEFRAILFIPDRAPWNYYETYHSWKPQLKLYVQQVAVKGNKYPLLPKYLAWVIGVVDAAALSMHISRDVVQSSLIKAIRKKLVRKVIQLVGELSDRAAAASNVLHSLSCQDSSAENQVCEVSSTYEHSHLEMDIRRYDTFWSEFGRAVKLGIVEDDLNRSKLSLMLRFYTTSSPFNLTTIQDYVNRMRPGQNHIFFLCERSIQAALQSPHLEHFQGQHVEVILLTDLVDEYMMEKLLEFKGTRFHNIAKTGLETVAGIKDSGSSLEDLSLKDRFQPLTDWWKRALSHVPMLEEVRVSTRLTHSPCIVVSSKFGMSAQMERALTAQSNKRDNHGVFSGAKFLEINPDHPLILKILEQFTNDPDNKDASLAANVLFDVAMLQSGYAPADQNMFASQVHQLLDLVLLQDASCDSGDKLEDAGSLNVQAAFDPSFVHHAAIMQTHE